MSLMKGSHESRASTITASLSYLLIKLNSSLGLSSSLQIFPLMNASISDSF